MMDLLRSYIRAILNEEPRDRMVSGPASFTAPERAEFNDDDVSLGDDHLEDETVGDKYGPVPPVAEDPKCYQDPTTRDYLRWSGTTNR